MKNISLALNGVLAVAVIILYVLHFNGQSAPATVGESNTQEVANDSTGTAPAPLKLATPSTQAAQFPIGYVNLDTLLKQYDYVADIEKTMKREETKARNKLQGEVQTLQEDQARFQDIMQTGGFTSEQQAQDQYTMLLQREQEIMKKEQELMLQLQNKQLKFTEQLSKNIKEYLGEYNDDLRYSYILPYGTGQPILYANDSLDITGPILQGLNYKYKASRNKK